MLFDLKELQSSDIYKLMSQGVIPRPIAWIVTKQKEIINIAPFSYFTPLSSNPPTVIVSIGHKADGSPKDTLANIKETKKCTICMVNEDKLEKMHFSSKALPKEISEASEFNIKTKEVIDTFPPMIEDTTYALFCTLNQFVEISSPTIPTILNVEAIYIDNRVITSKEKLDFGFKTVARVGRKYAFLGKEIEPPVIK